MKVLQKCRESWTEWSIGCYERRIQYGGPTCKVHSSTHKFPNQIMSLLFYHLCESIRLCFFPKMLSAHARAIHMQRSARAPWLFQKSFDKTMRYTLKRDVSHKRRRRCLLSFGEYQFKIDRYILKSLQPLFYWTCRKLNHANKSNPFDNVLI